jgi:hypothetical protein
MGSNPALKSKCVRSLGRGLQYGPLKWLGVKLSHIGGLPSLAARLCDRSGYHSQGRQHSGYPQVTHKEARLSWRHAAAIARVIHCKDSNTMGTLPAMKSKSVRPLGRGLQYGALKWLGVKLSHIRRLAELGGTPLRSLGVLIVRTAT